MPVPNGVGLTNWQGDNYTNPSNMHNPCQLKSTNNVGFINSGFRKFYFNLLFDFCRIPA
jgi:hypothetical protein